jgi:hypothetical protein
MLQAQCAPRYVGQFSGGIHHSVGVGIIIGNVGVKHGTD